MGIRLGPPKLAESARTDAATCRSRPRHDPPAPLTAKYIQIRNKAKCRNDDHYSMKGDVLNSSNSVSHSMGQLDVTELIQLTRTKNNVL